MLAGSPGQAHFVGNAAPSSSFCRISVCWCVDTSGYFRSHEIYLRHKYRVKVESTTQPFLSSSRPFCDNFCPNSIGMHTITVHTIIFQSNVCPYTVILCSKSMHNYSSTSLVYFFPKQIWRLMNGRQTFFQNSKFHKFLQFINA